VIVGIPGFGFRGDLRADDPVVQGSRTFVPVLTEQDFYRAEKHLIETFAPLVPIERVWVEQLAPRRGEVGEQYNTLDAPPRRIPTLATLVTRTTGLRVIQAVPDGHVRDLRAITDTYLNAEGRHSVRVCGEADWHDWGMTGSTPQSTEIDASSLWVE